MTASPKASTNSNNWIVPALISSGVSVAAVLCGYWAVSQHEKHLRSKWLQEEEEKQKDSNTQQDFEDGEAAANTSLYSLIGHFKFLELSAESTILEANRRRTTSYYEKAREAHEQSLVLGIPSYSELLKKRKQEMERLLFYHNEGKRSLRTVIVMLDALSQDVLSEARQKILQPLNYSWDIYSKGVWIPQISIIPNEDMHVTVACPWWWHTMREGNDELNRDLSNRLMQALVIDFHHPFLLELERIVLLGGKTLVALWRTVGDRLVVEESNNNNNGNGNGNGGQSSIVVCDRHATTTDPMVRLRREIVDCFTNDRHQHKFRPLTHQHRKNESFSNEPPTPAKEPAPPPLPPAPGKIVRTHTIEAKTPGLGSGDGFIHTTLCRLPLECFSTHDVELEPIHRLCREATATYSGHRMLVNRFRFVETTGEGGDSNPCKNPRFDRKLVAPLKVVPRKLTVEEGGGGGSNELEKSGNARSLSTSNAERNALTTGRVPDLTLNQGTTNNPGGVEGLFDPPNSSNHRMQTSKLGIGFRY